MIQLKAQKSLGQNFLVDPKAHERIVRALAPKPEDTFVEIGPGTGLLTKRLLASPLKRLIAFELDSRAVPELRREFVAEAERFEVIEADILKVDLQELSIRLQSKLRVVGNIPYYITSPILFGAIGSRQVISDATFLVQLEVAERLTAKPSTKAYGIPTVLANFFGNVRFLFKVPAGAFRPVPRVDSAVIHIDFEQNYFTRTNSLRPSGFDDLLFTKIVRTLFGMRRKTIRNNLKSILTADQVGALEALEIVDTGPKSVSRFLSARAESLTIGDFIELTEAIRKS